MEIAFLTASISRRAGGLFDAVRGLSDALRDWAGISVRIFSVEDEYARLDVGAWGAAKVRLFPVCGPKFFGYAPHLASVLCETDLDLIHSHGLWMFPSVASLQWARNRKKPYMITPHGMLNPLALKMSRWKKKLAGWIYENAHLRGATCLHSLSETEAQSIRTYGLRNPVCIIPNGVDFPEVAKAPFPPCEGVVPTEAKALLYLGRLHRQKNLPSLLHAWALARRQGVRNMGEWILVIAGWDQNGHEGELKDLCRELGIEESIHFVGPQFGSHKHSWYSRADAFILPSFFEALPMVVLEAWSHGLPVVMTAQCNLAEGFRAGAAIQIDPEVESIARALVALFMMTDSEREVMGARGRELVGERFSWPKIAAEMKAVYEWMLGGGVPPACIEFLK